MNDIIFKIVFGTQPNEPILRALLNALLGLSGPDRIVELTILNPHVDKAYLNDRGAILDIKARDGRGQLYNVEVQVSDEADYVKRSLYYLARLFGEQLEKGDPYDEIARTVGISILDYCLFPDQEDLHSTYRFYDAVHGRELSDVIEIHYIELVKFWKDRPHALRTPFEKWLHVLKFSDLYDDLAAALPEPLQQEEGIAMAIDAFKRARASDEVREMIEFRLKAEHDEATRMKHGMDRARREGLEQGLEQGLERGQALERRNVARKMLESGMDRSKVTELTGLAPEDLPPV